jgi:hypothetical protein
LKIWCGKEMKKFLVTACGAILIGLLMISSATAVPKVNSDPLMGKINEIEKNKKTIEENINNKTLDLKTKGSINLLIKKIKDTIYSITLDLKSGLLINLLVKIIQWLISLVQELINFVNNLFNLVELIYTLINSIVTLYELIIQLINYIKDIFTPQILKSTT